MEENYLTTYTAISDDVASVVPVDDNDIRGTSADVHVGLLVTQSLLVLFGVIGVLDNGTVVYVTSRFSAVRKKLGNIYIMHQCIVDLISSILLIVTYLLLIFLPHYQSNLYFCQWVTGEGILWSAIDVSTHNLMILTVERYLKIIFPKVHEILCTKTIARITIATMWVVHLGCKVPISVVTTTVVDGQCMIEVVWPYPEMQHSLALVALAVLYFIPLFVMIVCYTHIIIYVRRTKAAVARFASESGSQPRSNVSAEEIEILKTLVLVCVGFFVCWTPAKLVYVFYSVGLPVNLHEYGYYITLLLSFANSFINPFIYVAKYRDVRRSISTMIGGGGGGGPAAAQNQARSADTIKNSSSGQTDHSNI